VGPRAEQRPDPWRGIQRRGEPASTTQDQRTRHREHCPPHGGGAQPGDDRAQAGEPAGGRRGLFPETEIDPLHRAEWYYRDAVRVRAEADIAVRPQASGYLSSEGIQIRINAGEPAVQRPQRISIKSDRRLRDQVDRRMQLVGTGLSHAPIITRDLRHIDGRPAGSCAVAGSAFGRAPGMVLVIH